MAESELKYNSAEKVEETGEVVLPRAAHPMVVRSELSKLVTVGAIDPGDMDTRYDEWLRERQSQDGIPVEEALGALVEEGVLGQKEANVLLHEYKN